ncbi:MAG: rhodanese-related sulfurtransferase [Flavobacteriales bacterium]|jgi:rhodanese-related sulfurtransferase
MTQGHFDVSFKIEVALKKMLKRSVPLISTGMLADSISRESDWVILDSRELAEFDMSHLPNAKWVGHIDFSMLRVLDIPKDAKVVVYCSIGVRSEKVAEKLLSSGFSNVKNLYGGIFSWSNENKTLVQENQQPTLAVHGYDQKWVTLLNNSVLNR